VTRLVIIGGGPAGYEAALVAAQLGARTTLVEQDGPGGACVLTDCVPSKTFIAVSDVMNVLSRLEVLGVRARPATGLHADAPAVHGRVVDLASAQSADIESRLLTAGVRVVRGTGRFAGPREPDASYRISVRTGAEEEETLAADVVLVATGASPRVLDAARPDGRRILTWRDLYQLDALPERLVVVGSGVTGAEFASAYCAMGVDTVLVSSRDHVLPGEDPDAAAVLEAVLSERGMEIVPRARAQAVAEAGDGVRVILEDGRTVTGSHVLMTIGSVPNSAGLGLEHVGVEPAGGGFLAVDRVSRTGAPNVYAAGDVTGVMMLASVAAMQGRIAVWHALGEAVAPLNLATVSSNVFTNPEISTVGVTQRQVDAGEIAARTVTLPLETNARAKMMGLGFGFVKLFCRPSSGIVIGGVVVAPRASELILPVTMAVQNSLTVDQFAQTFAIYPSLSGSMTEAARLLMRGS